MAGSQVWLLGGLAVLAGCGDSRVREPGAELLATDPAQMATVPEARGEAGVGRSGRFRFFVSGHSLVDQPFPDYLASIARESASEVSFDRRYVVGSSIRQRGPADLPGAPPDVLLITENHWLLGNLAWNDTVGELRKWHDALIASNGAGRTIFYVPWLSWDDRTDPTSWLAYEQAASPVWRCAVARVNIDLAAAGRTDRVEFLPANLALADLIRFIQEGGELEGLPGRTPRERLDAIFSDDVHLTALGAYYIAAYTAAALGLLPAAAPVEPPEGAQLTAEVANSLRRHAAKFLAGRSAAAQPVLTPAACRAFIAKTFAADFFSYIYRMMRGSGSGHFAALWSTTKWRIQTGLILRDRRDGPFRDDPAPR